MVEPRPPGYLLVDPNPIAAEAPYTFFMASQEEKDSVGVGDLVKLIFEWDPPGKEWEAERMWVKITAVRGRDLVGTLENEPFEKNRLAIGAVVNFSTQHIVDIVWDEPELAPPAPRRRQYWERCLVDACVVEAGAPVEYVYREEPDMASPDEEYPDSGWRIRARVDPEGADETDEAAPLYIAVGAVLNADDSWLPLIDAPIGSAFKRSFETGEYIPVE